MGAMLPTADLVIGMDLFVRNRPRLRAFAHPCVDLRLFRGDSSSDDVQSAIRATLNGRQIDLLFIDGDHTFAGALADCRFYSQFVAPRGLIAFHDIVPSFR